MQNIIPLIKLLESSLQKGESFEKFNLSEKGRKLCEMVVAGEVSSDTGAAKALYGSADNRSYSMFKHRFKSELIKTIGKVDFVIGSEVQIQYAFVNEALLACKKLYSLGMSRESTDILENIYKKARKYKFYAEACQITRMLASYYRVFYFDPERSENLYEMNKCLQEMVSLETLCEKYYSEVISEYAINIKSKEELSAISKKYYRELEEKRIDSPLYMKFFYCTKVMHFYISGESKRALEYNNEALEYFRSLEYKHTAAIGIFRRQEMSILLDCEMYEEAREVLEDTFKEGDLPFAYFRNKQLQFLVNLRLKDYYKADEICQEVLKDPRLKYEQDLRKDKWSLYALLISVLIPEKTDKNIMKKLVNYRSDKKGINALIIICELLYHHFQGNAEFIYDRRRMIRDYIKKHLDRKEDKRTILFMRMICELPKRNFSPGFIERTDAMLARLEEIPVNHNEFEPIKYEEMWAWLTRERRQRMVG